MSNVIYSKFCNIIQDRDSQLRILRSEISLLRALSNNNIFDNVSGINCKTNVDHKYLRSKQINSQLNDLVTNLNARIKYLEYENDRLRQLNNYNCQKLDNLNKRIN